jgi:hypothetical protein
LSNAEQRSAEQAGPASQTSFTPDLTNRPRSAHRGKFSANLLQNIVLALKSIELQKLLRPSAVVQKIVSSDAVIQRDGKAVGQRPSP